MNGGWEVNKEDLGLLGYCSHVLERTLLEEDQLF